MPIQYRVEEEGHLVLAHSSGVISDADLVELMRAVAADARIVPHFRGLLDLGNASVLDVTREGIEEVARTQLEFAEKFTGMRGAIVVSQQEGFVYSQIFEQIKKPEAVVVIVFSDMDIARIWLGIADAAERSS